MNLDEAWNCIDKFHQINWLEVINREFNQMRNKGVWEVIDSNDIPNDRRYIKCKWILKSKETKFFAQDLFHVDKSKFLALILMKVSLLL
jgi:hypothetical protein